MLYIIEVIHSDRLTIANVKMYFIGTQFNRAAIMNVGVAESLKLANWDCFIFHDIDLIPLDDRNLYTCPDQPRHMSVAVDTLNYK